jgi:hypothetical protein
MININTLTQAKELKKIADSSYIVFKKNPTTVNASNWTVASRNFTDFCVKTISDLIIEDQDLTSEILANPDRYKTCKQCDAELLYLTDANNYVASSDFVEAFPGWCYPCLVEYCTTHECEGCTVTTRPFNCPFSEVKKLHLNQMQGDI